MNKDQDLVLWHQGEALDRELGCDDMERRLTSRDEKQVAHGGLARPSIAKGCPDLGEPGRAGPSKLRRHSAGNTRCDANLCQEQAHRSDRLFRSVVLGASWLDGGYDIQCAQECTIRHSSQGLDTGAQ